MPKNDTNAHAATKKTWTLPLAVTLGSSVRARGILLELRARLPVASRKSLEIDGKTLALAMQSNGAEEFRIAADLIGRSLETIEDLPVIPREIEDILTITTSERRRWLEDGRLPSAGTRTVRLKGRARQITFHVFDPKAVEALLDKGAVDEWREEDAAARLEKRRQAAYRGKLTRSLKKGADGKSKAAVGADDASSRLSGWEEFGKDGLLR